jgi:hypothetical protein
MVAYLAKPKPLALAIEIPGTLVSTKVVRANHSDQHDRSLGHG